MIILSAYLQNILCPFFPCDSNPLIFFLWETTAAQCSMLSIEDVVQLPLKKVERFPLTCVEIGSRPWEANQHGKYAHAYPITVYLCLKKLCTTNLAN